MRIRTQNLRQQHGILKSVVDAVGGNPTQQKKKDEKTIYSTESKPQPQTARPRQKIRGTTAAPRTPNPAG